jgi:hypothetical protein
MPDVPQPVLADRFPSEDVEPKPKLHQTLVQWIIGIAVAVSAVGGLVKLSNQFLLPSCSEERTIATLKDIFKQKDVEVTGLGDFAALTQSSSEKTCTAQVEAPHAVTINYRIFWEGWTAKVMITQVR